MSVNTASQAVTVDTAAPEAPSITAIPENGGGGINAGEASNGTPVVVGLAGTGAVAGDRLTINWGSQTVTYTLLAGDISGNSATVTVPLATIAAQGQGTFNVTARLTDTAGNVGSNSTATSVKVISVDVLAPTAAVAITAIATDSGPSSSDYVTNDTTLTVSGTHGLLGPGETVQVSSDGGASWFNATSTASTWSYTDPTTHGTSFTYRVRTIDTAGNIGANTTSQAVTIDTVAPAAPSITAIPENGGGGINAAEASDGTPVVVGLTGTGAAAGDTLTIHWGSQTVNYTLLAGDISGNSATVTVPLATIMAQGQGTFDVTARLTDTAGNASSSSRATSVTVAGGHGDVHMVCFDGLTYDFQAVGDYVAVQSTDAGNPWEVQTGPGHFLAPPASRQRLPRRSALTTCPSPSVGPIPFLSTVRPTRCRLAPCKGSRAAPWRNLPTTFTSSTGTRARVVTVTDQGGYLDWTVGLGPHDGPGSVRGLLGSNSGPATDFQLPTVRSLRIRVTPRSSPCSPSVERGAWHVASGRNPCTEPRTARPDDGGNA